MIQRMRGAIDPYTLGFLISIIGSLVAVGVHSNDPAPEQPSLSVHASKATLNAQTGSKADDE